MDVAAELGESLSKTIVDLRAPPTVLVPQSLAILAKLVLSEYEAGTIACEMKGL